MARRRKKNNLLPKMIGIAVLVNAILIPLLAKFGAFKGIHGKHVEDIKLVNLPPPVKKPEPKKSQPKKRVAKARPRAAARTAARTAPSRPNPNQPKVVASASSGGGNRPGIDNSGTAVAGQVPVTPPIPPAAPTPPAIPPAPAPVPAPTPAPPPVPVAVPVPPHVPTIVAAEPLDQPRPQIPDDLSADDIQSAFTAVFTISAGGGVSVKMVTSTGNATLDALALDAARRWTFRPATVDGKPIESYRRLSVEFYPT